MTPRSTSARFVSLTAVMLLAIGAAACGGDDVADDPTTTIATTTTTPTTTTEATTTTTTTPEPVGEPELVWRVEYEASVDDLAVAPDGSVVAVAEHAAYLHRLADGLLVDAVVYELHYPQRLDYAPDGSLLGAGLGVYGVVLTDASGQVREELPGGHDSTVAFSPSGEVIATGDRDGVVTLWSVADGSLIAELAAADLEQRWTPVGLTVMSLRFDPTGTFLAAVHFDCFADVWDVGSGTVVHRLELNTGGDGSCGFGTGLLVFSPSEGLMAGVVSEEGDTVVRLWSIDGAEQVADLPVLPRVRSIAFSPDGSLLVVASRTGTTIWDVASAAQVYALDETFDATATEQPSVAVFTPDGGHIVVGRSNGWVELWRLPGADPLPVPEPVACEPMPLPGDVLFATGSAELRPEADTVLAELAEELRASAPEATLTFVGHTDSRGSAEANLALSVDRAESVRAWFEAWAAQEGVAWTVLVEGRGETELKVPDVDADGRFLTGAGALNRRVEIEIEDPICG